MTKLLVLLVVSLAVAAFAQEDDVVVLNTENFDSAIAENEFILVEFYAPWCGHCKHLAPEYAKAATDVKEDGIVLAKVDATENQQLGSTYGVKGYPTLIFFRNGDQLAYNGPRDAAGIAQWVRKKSGPVAVTLTTADEYNAFIQDNSVAIVGFFDSASSDDAAAFLAAASSPDVDSFAFGYILSAELVAEVEGTLNSVKLFRDHDENVVYNEETDEDVVEFVLDNGFPYLEPATESWSRLRANGLPIVLLVLDTNADDAQKYLDYAAGLAKLRKDNFGFAYLGLDFLKNVKDFGVTGEQLPTMVTISDTGKNYPFDDAVEFNADNVDAWLDGIVAGTVAPFFKSEEIPETNDGDVYVLVGKAFDDVTKDGFVFVEFYAPWCGHCKSLAPVWEELGAAFADNDDVIIAKMDSTANDNSAVQIKGFPTLYFFNQGTPVEYQGGRDLASLTAFVNEQIGAVEGTAEGSDDVDVEEDDHAHTDL